MASFGTYTLHEQLGAGARGSVHRATVREDDDLRSVAVKTIPASLFPNASAASEHAAEIERAVELRHPNIVATYRVGRIDETSFVEMEHVRGQSLDEILHDVRTDGPPPIEVVASLVAELCDALEFAHQRGIVHGDLRPCHLLVDASGHLKVLGFGMSRLEQPLSQRSYAAPETLDTGAATARADLFSVGVIAYELVTGRPLFGEHMDAHMRGYIGTSVAAPSRYNPSCPPTLDDIILRALAPDPAQRWAAARDIRIALGRVGGPRADAVNEWLGAHAGTAPGDAPAPVSAPMAIALPLPANAPPLPRPPRRTPRGSGQLPPPAERRAPAVAGPALHEAATVLRPPTGTGPRNFRLPIEAPPEPYVLLDEVDELAAEEIALDEDTPELELTDWEAPAPQAPNMQSAPRAWGRYVELGVAFAAGALAMYLVGLLLG